MNVGILGCGTIGGGVLDLLNKLPSSYGVKVLKVFDLPSKKDFLGDLFAENADDVCLNKDIDVVVEAMGGNQFPYECIVKALKSKKSVVTSNKEVVSLHIEEFYSLAKENGVYFMCEASVGGGIPLICSLIDETKINDVTSIKGIINGTTNFILTKMKNEGMSLDDALSEAKRLGFAEYDATADLEGLDMVRKISILSTIAYGGLVPFDKIKHYGITKVTKEIFKDVESKGYTLKFMAQSILKDGKVQAAVEPVLLCNSSSFSGVSYEFNAVMLDCSTNGELMFYGKGAGRYPTASAMVMDTVRILEKIKPYYYEKGKTYEVENFDGDSEYYIVNGGKSEIVKGLKNADKLDFYARIIK